MKKFIFHKILFVLVFFPSFFSFANSKEPVNYHLNDSLVYFAAIKPLPKIQLFEDINDGPIVKVLIENEKKINYIEDNLGMDCLKYSVIVGKPNYKVGEKAQITVKLEYLDWLHQNFRNEDCQNLAIKMVFPNGFVQTGGNYFDYMPIELNENNKSLEINIEGIFLEINSLACFTLLKGPKVSNSETIFIRKNETCVFVTENENPKSIAKSIKEITIQAPEQKAVTAVSPRPTASPISIWCRGVASLSASNCVGGIYTWYNDATGGSILGSGNSGTYVTPFELNESTVYSVTCTQDGKDESPRRTIAITITKPSASNRSTEIDPVCTGTNISLVARPNSITEYTYLWTGPDQLSNSNRVAVVEVPAENGVYSITVTKDGVSCMATTQVYVKPTPVISQVNGLNKLCIGNSLNLTSDLPNGTWGTTTATRANVDNNGMVTGLTAGIARINYTVNSCLSSDFLVTILTPPSDITGSSNVCEGSSIRLTSTGAGLWESSNPLVATVDQTGRVFGNVAGTTLITKTNDICSKSFSVTVLPKPTISGDNFICVGGTKSLNTNLNGGVWSSSNTNRVTIDPNTGVITGIATGSSNITYSINGCVSSNFLVTVNPLPIIRGTVSTVCLGSFIDLEITNVPGGIWSSGSENIATIDQNGRLNGLSLGTSVISYTSPSSCVVTRTITVINNPSPAPTINQLNTEVCEGTPFRLNGSWSGTDPATYSWTIPTQPTTTKINGKVYNALAENSVVALSGTYTFTVKVGSCITTATTNVIIGAQPTLAAASSNSPVCIGQSLNLNATGGNSFSWSGPNGAVSNVIDNVVSSMAGIYTVTVKNAGCNTTLTATTNVVINEMPIPIFNGNTTVCEGGVLDIQVSGITGYFWTNPSGLILPDLNIPILQLEDAGVYTLNQTNPICEVNRTLEIIVLPKPVGPTISASGPLTFCEGGSVTLTASGCSGIVTWNDAQNTISNTLLITEAGSYSATCKIGSENNFCVSLPSEPIVVSYSQAITPTLLYSKLILQNDQESIYVSTSNNCEGNILWSNGETTNAINVATPGVYYAQCQIGNCFSGRSEVIRITAEEKPQFSLISVTEECEGSNRIAFSASCPNIYYSYGFVNIEGYDQNNELAFEKVLYYDSYYTGIPSMEFVAIQNLKYRIRCTDAYGRGNHPVSTWSNYWQDNTVYDSNLNIGYPKIITEYTKKIDRGSLNFGFCNKEFIQANGCLNGASIRWKLFDGNTGQSQFVNQDFIPTNAVNGLVELSCVKGTCESEKIQFYVKSQTAITVPNVVLTSNNNTICKGQNSWQIYTDLGTGYNSNYDVLYSWENQDGTIGSKMYGYAIQSEPLYQNRTFRAKYVSACGISSEWSNPITITVVPEPQKPILTVVEPQTEGGQYTISASGCNGTLNWYTPENGVQTGNSINVSLGNRISVYCSNGLCESEFEILYLTRQTPSNPSIFYGQSNYLCLANNSEINLSGNCQNSIPEWENIPSGQSTIYVNNPGIYRLRCKTYFDVSDWAEIEIFESNPIIESISSNSPQNGGRLNLNLVSIGSDVFNWTGPNGFTSTEINPIINNVTLASSGTYYVTVGSGACSATASVEVVITAGETFEISIANNQICNGVENVINSTGCIGIVQWSNGETGANLYIYGGGVYSAQCFDNEGNLISFSNQLQVTELPKPFAPNIISENGFYFCNNESITLIAEGCETETVWSDNSIGNSITLNKTGEYFASCRNPEGCLSEKTYFYLERNINKPNVSVDKQIFQSETEINAILSVYCDNGTPIWSNGATSEQIQVNAIGYYTVVCTDGTCISDVSDVIQISTCELFEPEISITNLSNSCLGNESVSATLSVNCPIYWQAELKAFDQNEVEIFSKPFYSGDGVNVSQITSFKIRCFENSNTSPCITKWSDPITINAGGPSNPIVSTDKVLQYYVDGNNLPNGSDFYPTLNVCLDESLTLNATGCSANSSINWIYNFNNTNGDYTNENFNGGQIQLSNSESGYGTIQVFCIDESGCTSEYKYFNLIVNPQPEILSISTNSENVSIGDPVEIYVSNYLEGSNKKFSLSIANSTGTQIVEYTDVSNYITTAPIFEPTTFKVKFSNFCGESQEWSNDLLVGVMALPPPVIYSPSANNDVVTLNGPNENVAIYSPYGCSVGTIVWSNSSIIGSANSTIFIEDENTVITARCSNNGAISEPSNAITFQRCNLVNPNISPNVAVNACDLVVLTVTGCTAPYEWAHIIDASNQAIGLQPFDSNTSGVFEINPVKTTTYKAFCADQFKNCGSRYSNTITVTINEEVGTPIVSTSNSAICSGSSTTMTASGCASATIKWYDSNGVNVGEGESFNTGTLNYSTPYAPDSPLNAPYNYITYTAKCNLNGCEGAPGFSSVYVYKPIIKPNIEIVYGEYLCNNNNSQGALLSGICPSFAKLMWSSGGIIGGFNNAGTLNVNPTVNTSYYAYCKGEGGSESQNEVGCLSSNSDPVTIFITNEGTPLPTPILEASKTTFCQSSTNEKVTLSVPNCLTTINWEITNEDGSLSYENFKSPYIITELSQNKSYRVRCNNGCELSDFSNSINITLFTGSADIVVSTISSNSPVNTGSSLNLQVETEGGTAYSWTGPNGFTSTEQNPIIASAVVANSGTYTVTVSSAVGCSITATIAVVTNDLTACECTTCDAITEANYSEWPTPNSTTIAIDRNYVEERVYLTDDATQYAQTIQYFDGMGRPIQKVSRNTGAEGNDIITFMNYDAYGREVEKYMPYTGNHLLTGPLLSNNDHLNLQKAFYEQIPGKIADKDYAFSKIIFEDSPVNRPLQEGAPGLMWQPKLDINATNNHAIKMIYTTNTFGGTANTIDEKLVNNVKHCNINSIAAEIEDQEVVLSNHNAKQLTVSLTIDENGNRSAEFKDKAGMLICKRVQDKANSFIETNYAYDDFGRLRFVFQPEAEQALATASLQVSTSTIKPLAPTSSIKELTFAYNYDKRGRIIQKKVPSASKVEMVYDRRDRLVFTQDAWGRANNRNRWLYTEYDAVNRPIALGYYTQNISRVDLQNNVTDGTALSGTKLAITVNTYDAYESTDESQYAKSETFGQTKLTNLRGRITKSVTRVVSVDETNSLWNKPTSIISFYDTKGRPIKNISTNHTGGKEISVTKLDYSGRAITSTQFTTYKKSNLDSVKHVIKTKNTYDKGGRVLTLCQKIDDDNWEQVSKNQYYPLGELKTKGLGCDNSTGSPLALQNVDYEYNIRGWLTDINKIADASMTANKDLFAMKLSYATATSYDGAEVSNTFFNGNIVKQEWNTLRSLSGAEVSGIQTYNYKYDKQNRLMEGIYTGTIAEGISTTMFDATRGYNKNGNIGYLKRTTGGGATLMDELIYSYSANQLTKVLDNGDDTKSFKDKENTIDYAYDQAGNMITDANKDLSIDYNHLNLPGSITRNSSLNGTPPGGAEVNGVIKHYYAGATKVRMETYDAAGTTLTKAYDYMSGMVYVTNPSEPIEANKKTLDFISSPEGRAILTSKILGISAPPPGPGGADKFRFEYSLKDHLGNLRVSCRCGELKRDAQGIIIPEGTDGAGIEPLAVVQEQHYDPWGLAFSTTIAPPSGTAGADRFTYNGKELLSDLDLGWNDYGARMYMSEIGKWNGVDPLAEKAVEKTIYHYVSNNPISRIDPDGEFDDYYIRNNGEIIVKKTDDNFDRFFTESSQKTKGKIIVRTYKLEAQIDKNDAGYLALPNSFFGEGYGFKYTGSKNENFVSGPAFAGLLGALKESQISDVSLNHWSNEDGSSPKPSRSHKNGNVGDIRPLRLDRSGEPVLTTDSQFDASRNATLISSLKKFGWTSILSEKNPTTGYLTPGSKHYSGYYDNGEWIPVRHNNHYHIQKFKPNLIPYSPFKLR